MGVFVVFYSLEAGPTGPGYAEGEGITQEAGIGKSHFRSCLRHSAWYIVSAQEKLLVLGLVTLSLCL